MFRIGYFLLYGAICLFISCNNIGSVKWQPNNTTDSLNLEAEVDSSHTIQQDGLDYDPLNTGTYGQLPAFLTNWLNQKYAGWSLPPLPAELLKNYKKIAPGPYYVSGNFNNNTIPDYAVLFRYQDLVITIALLETGVENVPPKAFILEKNDLGKINGELQSQQYLTRRLKGTKVKTPENPALELNLDAIGVATREVIHLYYFNGQEFSSLTEPQQNRN